MTTTEEVIRLAGEITDTVRNEIGPVAMCKDPLSLAQKVSTRVAAIAKAEETEALTAAINALEDIAGTSSSTRIRRVANEALKATRARRKA